MGKDGDLFDVFDKSDDEEQTTITTTINGQQMLRDPENGVLVFHGGTEKALLVFVKNSISKEQLNRTPLEKLVLLVDLIDRFCYERHWMMNIGPEKGKTLDDFLGECLEVTRTKARETNTFTFVELGTYFDVEIETIRIAQEFVTMVGLQDCVTFLHLSHSGEAQQLSSMLLTSMQERLSFKTVSTPQIDFLFIDHEKKAYLPDFKQLQSKGFIQKGSYVAADNVLFHGIDDYRIYIGSLEEEGVVDSRLVEGSLEYVNDRTLLQERRLTEVRDGIELTIFKK